MNNIKEVTRKMVVGFGLTYGYKSVKKLVDNVASEIDQLYNEAQPDQSSRLLTPEVMDAIRAKWYNEDKGETRRFVNLVKMSAKAQLAKDDARIEALRADCWEFVQAVNKGPLMHGDIQLDPVRFSKFAQMIQGLKANPTSEVEG